MTADTERRWNKVIEDSKLEAEKTAKEQEKVKAQWALNKDWLRKAETCSK